MSEPDLRRHNASREPAPNPLSGTPLDRVAHRRTDAAWVAAAVGAPDTRVVPVSGGRVLVVADASGAASRAVTLPGGAVGLVDPAAAADHASALLGLQDGTAYFAVDVAAGGADAVLAAAGPGAAWSELRPAALALPAGEGSLVAYARAMLWWHSRHRFCGVCGAPTVVEEAGHVRACPACAARHFPRTDPAVIVLVTHPGPSGAAADEACLLGSAPGWPEGMYSTLAGFAEPGESLEDTVRREMFEEAGVRVGDVRYSSSQPWPFPQSLMVGFTARAEDRALRVDTAELRDARWFTRAELEAAIAERSVWVPPRLSISRRLIEDWRGARAA